MRQEFDYSIRPTTVFLQFGKLGSSYKAKRVASLQSRKDLPVTQKGKKMNNPQSK
jgi:hypothetical protein